MMLAADPAVPQRDALLSAKVVAEVFPGATTCERVYAKYRVGESLRVAYRLDGAHHVAARTFREGRSEAAYAANALLHAPKLDTVFWAFPNDRKLATLPLLASPPAVAELIGRPCAALRLVAYASERSACARCLDASGQAVAYVKVHADAEQERQRLEAAGPLAPKTIATSHGALALEPVEGRRLDTLRAADLARALHGLGAALATLHAACALPEVPFRRLDRDRLISAAAVISRARPDAKAAADRALAGLLDRIDDAGHTVCVHGDANLRNAIATGTGVTLLDLEHAAAGPAAADLGQLLAGLTADRVLGRISAADERAFADSLLDGYGDTPHALRWHVDASLLVRVAQSAINRVRPDILHRLVPLLEAATP
jgi:aminoglycoside phosphotransferase